MNGCKLNITSDMPSPEAFRNPRRLISLRIKSTRK